MNNGAVHESVTINSTPLNETIFVYDRFTELLSNFLWWYVIVMAAIGMALNTGGVVYLLSRRSNCTVLPCMISVIIADCIFLASVLGGLLIAELFPQFPGSVICKVMAFSTNTTSLFSNWCWVILWGGRYLAVFHPWVYYKFKYYSKLNRMLPGLLVVCVGLECWTLIYATEVDYNCDLDESLASYDTFKYLFLFEHCLAFFLPFTLILIADIRVFSRRSPLEQMEPSDFRTDSNRRTNLKIEQVMIVSRKYKRTSIALKHRMIKRFVVLASVDLLFNFPNVIVHLIQAFQRGNVDKDSVSHSADRLGFTISAISYSLFYLQYVLNVVHIRLLIGGYVRTEVSSPGSGYHTPTKIGKDMANGNSVISVWSKAETDKNNQYSEFKWLLPGSRNCFTNKKTSSVRL